MEVLTAGLPAYHGLGPAGDFGPLFTIREVIARGPDAEPGLAAMARYVAEFLPSPHPDLGRPGAVCPFAARAIAADGIWLTSCRLAGHGPDEQRRIRAGMLALRSRLVQLQADESQATPRALVAVFPALTEPHGARMIERIQRELKLSFVEQRLMIGQFFPSCEEPGLRNPQFRPLQSPVIGLAIRSIAISDAPFMLGRQDYIDAYQRIFGDPGVERIENALREQRHAGSSASPDLGVAAGV